MLFVRSSTLRKELGIVRWPIRVKCADHPSGCETGGPVMRRAYGVEKPRPFATC